MTNVRAPRLMTPRAFARELGIGRDRCYAMLAADRIRHLSVGRRILIPASELDDFVERELARQERDSA